ncbi:hypothetical protein LJC56_11290 [Christensenellaceae bacterium OttesenSCG-928-K19]|nr:hypothetical protein [Christensenellaceae bacterium OttesenSCG-928-K19]
MKTKYKIDYLKQIVVITKEFAESAGIVGSTDYNLMKKIRREFPEYDYIMPTRKRSKQTNKRKNLSYENMEKYISIREGANSVNISNLHKLIAASPIQPSHYAFVADWFLTYYGDYRSPQALFTKVENVISHNEVVNKKTGEVIAIEDLTPLDGAEQSVG